MRAQLEKQLWLFWQDCQEKAWHHSLGLNQTPRVLKNVHWTDEIKVQIFGHDAQRCVW